MRNPAAKQRTSPESAPDPYQQTAENAKCVCMSDKIREIPKDQRPYEKCAKHGAGVLSDNELLAVILRTGTREKSALSLANQVLNSLRDPVYPGLSGLLHATLDELKRIPGIGEVKAIQLQCVGELSRRIASTTARQSLYYRDPGSIAQYFMESLRHEEQEVLYSMMLDTKGRYLGEYQVSRGTVNATISSPREIFIEALRKRASAIVLVHNHPSGDPAPSRQDEEMTRSVYQSGEMLNVWLWDHIIIGDHKYYSFREQGFFCEDTFPKSLRD